MGEGVPRGETGLPGRPPSGGRAARMDASPPQPRRGWTFGPGAAGRRLGEGRGVAVRRWAARRAGLHGEALHGGGARDGGRGGREEGRGRRGRRTRWGGGGGAGVGPTTGPGESDEGPGVGRGAEGRGGGPSCGGVWLATDLSR